MSPFAAWDVNVRPLDWPESLQMQTSRLSWKNIIYCEWKYGKLGSQETHYPSELPTLKEEYCDRPRWARSAIMQLQTPNWINDEALDCWTLEIWRFQKSNIYYKLYIVYIFSIELINVRLRNQCFCFCEATKLEGRISLRSLREKNTKRWNNALEDKMDVQNAFVWMIAPWHNRSHPSPEHILHKQCTKKQARTK